MENNLNGLEATAKLWSSNRSMQFVVAVEIVASERTRELIGFCAIGMNSVGIAGRLW